MKRTALILALSGSMVSGFASADAITFNAPAVLATTEINQTLTLGLFDTTLGTLNSVSLSFDAAIATVIEIWHTSTSAQSMSGRTIVDLDFTSSIGALNTWINLGNPLIILQKGTGNQLLDPNVHYTSPTLTESGIATYTNADGLLNSWFTQAGGGSFTIGCISQSGLLLTGGGGNVNGTQSTEAGCSAHITYDYTAGGAKVPEPASLSLLAVGILSLISTLDR